MNLSETVTYALDVKPPTLSPQGSPESWPLFSRREELGEVKSSWRVFCLFVLYG